MNDMSPVALGVDNGIAHVFDHIDNEGPMWAGSGKRWARSAVCFRTPFSQPPAVQLSIAMIDSDSSKNLRLELHAEDVTQLGLVIVAHTWMDTRIGRLQVHWTAIGARAVTTEPLWNV